MDKKGEIDHISKIVKPEIAIITNIGEAHFKNFNTLKDIAKAKAEIINNQSLQINKKGSPFIPLVMVRDKTTLPVDNMTTIKAGDLFHILVRTQTNGNPSRILKTLGFVRFEEIV